MGLENGKLTCKTVNFVFLMSFSNKLKNAISTR